MEDWGFAQADPAQQLARVHHFCVKKLQDSGEIEFNITIKEFCTPSIGALHFFAQADKQTNQKLAPYTPAGWGNTLLEALRECIQEINRFPYQAEEGQSTAV